MALERRETKRGHTYRLDGKPVKGVTTLLSAGLPKPALTQWAAKTVAEYVADNFEAVTAMHASMGREALVGALKATPWDKRDEAAARGTDVHALAETIIHGGEVEVPEHLVGHVQGYVRLIDGLGLEPILTERPCANRAVPYAGTFDAIGKVTRGSLAGQTLLIDWKTSKGVYGETALQLAAYQNADLYLSDDGHELQMPEVDGLAVVHITAHGSDLYPIADPDDAWRVFRHVAYLALKADAVKSQITDPIAIEEEAA